MTRFLSLTALLLAFSVSQAPAQQSRQQQEDACGRDATRYCKAVLNNGDYAVLECLKTNRAKLRPVCVSLLQQRGQIN
jgi:Cysteine rich repeat